MNTYRPSTGTIGTAVEMWIQIDATPVPSPFPILGLGAIFGYGRKLRKLTKANKTSELMGAID